MAPLVRRFGRKTPYPPGGDARIQISEGSFLRFCAFFRFDAVQQTRAQPRTTDLGGDVKIKGAPPAAAAWGGSDYFANCF